MCIKYYYEECLRLFKIVKFDGDRFFCLFYFCSICVINKFLVFRGRLIRCVRCLVVYYFFGCFVVGCILISFYFMVCAKYFLREKNKVYYIYVNVNWCFVCFIGGILICCESCFVVFYFECISYEGILEGYFFCKDCIESK